MLLIKFILSIILHFKINRILNPLQLCREIFCKRRMYKEAGLVARLQRLLKL
jgi:hypothetical protein